MSLQVLVWLPEPFRLVDGTEDGSELAGFESARTKLWGSEAVIELGAVFFPRLRGGDLYVQPEEMAEFRAECALLATHTDDLLTEASGYSEEYIATRLQNITNAANRATAIGGGILIW